MDKGALPLLNSESNLGVGGADRVGEPEVADCTRGADRCCSRRSANRGRTSSTVRSAIKKGSKSSSASSHGSSCQGVMGMMLSEGENQQRRKTSHRVNVSGLRRVGLNSQY
jgi:hypothetical protein